MNGFNSCCFAYGQTGSGKSYSMMFFSQKVLRKIPGNWSFVIVTDRQELDDQIYKTFADGGVITEEYAQATSSAHLRQLLTENHRFVFSLIHKFRAEPGMQHPMLSERLDEGFQGNLRKSILRLKFIDKWTDYFTEATNRKRPVPNLPVLLDLCL